MEVNLNGYINHWGTSIAMNPITPARYLEPDEDKLNYTLCPVCHYMTDQCECNDYFKEEE